ncbi:MAG: thioredoxin family protein [Actinomycetota bacterium]|nr:thioredoxin family protein [Actinomycetota bacterium]
MDSWLILVIAGAIAAFGLLFVVSQVLRMRAGLARGSTEVAEVDTSGLGLSTTGPTIVHFSAVWCGPCVALRRAVDEVCAQLPAVAHVEIDMDADPETAQRLSVLSLPTTFIFDADGRQRYRAAGVATVDELRDALEPLLA